MLKKARRRRRVVAAARTFVMTGRAHVDERIRRAHLLDRITKIDGSSTEERGHELQTACARIVDDAKMGAAERASAHVEAHLCDDATSR